MQVAWRQQREHADHWLDDCILGPRSFTVRVCHLSLGLSTGGLERLLVEFARLHDRSKVEPHFATLTTEGRPADDIRKVGAPVHVLSERQGRKLGQLVAVTRFLNRVRPDVVHTHNAYAHLYGSIAARLVGCPLVVHTRHGRALTGGRAERALFRVACNLSDAVVAVSEEVGILCREEGCPASKVHTIWNGIDTSRFCRPDDVVGSGFITVGRLEPVKDIGTLVRAFWQVRRQRPDVKLDIVGDGSERTALQVLAKELGLTDSVHFLGEQDDVPAILSRASVFVNCSLSEGISLSLLEAMSLGLGVIATRVGGNPEVIEDGRTGILVPPGEPVALSRAMLRLLDDAELGRLGRAAGKCTRERFDVRRMVADYEALYSELLASRAHSRGNC